ncbi:putative membrane protein YccC [Paraburkholderia fungorum]|jgi:uncharacterized membrane protein YccC|uniref:FUSC family protein n=1 Tax=Paraburkholderia fungorum TaxID=134537 RepID=UPI000D063C30|nr:FUSC family protein [Paraburkholderia fungorum]PRZ44961.1 putative membrane protein YccC [Paraburkholderia fungorum]
MSDVTSSNKARDFGVWRSALSDWAETDGKVWLYIFKVLVAVFCSQGIAMKLELPQPRTAMTTVFIVMQPQTGMVLAKSFYRICGTLVGLIGMLVLIATFAQQPELFILSTALWVGMCTAGAARNRNFRSYGFVLAGYTAALIGFPAAQNPGGAFITALTRVEEVMLGILCAGAVSALLFPQHAEAHVRKLVQGTFASFASFISAALAGRVDRDRLEDSSARFVSDVVQFEAARSAAFFEGPIARRRKGRLARLNTEFMAVSTRFHALHQFMNRLRANDMRGEVESMELLFSELSHLLTNDGAPNVTVENAASMADRLEAHKEALSRRIESLRSALRISDRASSLDFETGCELLTRFVDELHNYALTYASLALDAQVREQVSTSFQPRTNFMLAAVAGIRATIVVLVLGFFWVETAWPSGVTAILVGGTICALVSSTANPRRTAFQMAIGTLFASVTGMIVVFGLYPLIDGFPLLCLVLAPFLAAGVFMTVRPKLAGYGMGYCIFFSYLAGPDNVTVYRPDLFINDAMALVFAMFVASLAFAIFVPSATPWLRHQLLRELRSQVVSICTKKRIRRKDHTRARFESGTRDLILQLITVSGQIEPLRRNTLSWLFAVLEIGGAVLDIRILLSEISASAGAEKWRADVDAMLTEIGRLFDAPGPDRYSIALCTLNETLKSTLTANSVPLERDSEVRSAQNGPASVISRDLRFVQTALVDMKPIFCEDPA